ncbi:MAG: hypothetical protein AB1424_14350 [Thermodesulfobacteriota bacterium]
MGLSDLANIATIVASILFAITFLIDRWPQMTKLGKPYLPKIGLALMILAIISAGVSYYVSRHIPPRLIGNQEKLGPSKEEIELIVGKAVQKHIKEVTEASQGKFDIPKLGEKAVLKLPPLERPKLELFTEAEFKAIPITAHAKILNYLAEVNGYEDMADAAIEAHENYERSIFGGEKIK